MYKCGININYIKKKLDNFELKYEDFVIDFK